MQIWESSVKWICFTCGEIIGGKYRNFSFKKIGFQIQDDLALFFVSCFLLPVLALRANFSSLAATFLDQWLFSSRRRNLYCLDERRFVPAKLRFYLRDNGGFYQLIADLFQLFQTWRMIFLGQWRHFLLTFSNFYYGVNYKFSGFFYFVLNF